MPVSKLIQDFFWSVSSAKAHQYGAEGVHTSMGEEIHTGKHIQNSVHSWMAQRHCSGIGVTDVWQVLIFKTPTSPLQGKVEDRERVGREKIEKLKISCLEGRLDWCVSKSLKSYYFLKWCYRRRNQGQESLNHQLEVGPLEGEVSKSSYWGIWILCMREQKPEQSLNNRRMKPKPSFRKTSFSILCRVIVWCGPFPISAGLQCYFRIFLYCCSWCLSSHWLPDSYPSSGSLV